MIYKTRRNNIKKIRKLIKSKDCIMDNPSVLQRLLHRPRRSDFTSGIKVLR